MKKIKYAAVVMIICGGVAAVVGAAFLLSGSATARPEKDATAYAEEGNLYLDDGEYMKAVVSYKKAMDLGEKDEMVLEGSAEAYHALEFYDEEKGTREMLAESCPDNLDNWMELVMLKIKLDELEEAKDLVADLLTKYDDKELERLYHQMNIEDPVFSLEAGNYDTYQLLELQELPDNATVYYTLDGTEPDTFSNVYEDGIILSYPENTVKAKAVGFMGYESNVVELNYKITVPTEELGYGVFRDSRLEWAIRNKLDKDWNEPIYNYELAQFRSVYCVGQNYSYLEEQPVKFYENYYKRYESIYQDRGRTNMSVLRYMPFLKVLCICYQESIDLSGISDLEYLEEVSLLNDNITDIHALSGLKRLKKLALGWNNITDVSPLSGLSDLESLGLWNNEIKDISSLGGLKKLTYFDVTGNQIQDISCIQNMPDLMELWIAKNRIDDYTPIDSCDRLSVLMLADNPAGSYNMDEERDAKLMKTDMQMGGK